MGPYLPPYPDTGFDDPIGVDAGEGAISIGVIAHLPVWPHGSGPYSFVVETETSPGFRRGGLFDSYRTISISVKMIESRSYRNLKLDHKLDRTR